MLWAQCMLLGTFGFELLAFALYHGLERKLRDKNFWRDFFGILASFILIYFAGGFDRIF